MRKSPPAAKILALLGLALSASATVVAQQQLPAAVLRWPDTIYMNGMIVTLDDKEMNENPGTIVEAMAVHGEEIQALGKNAEILRMRGPKTQVIDLKGKMVLPGFVESHTHPFGDIREHLPPQKWRAPVVFMGVKVEKTAQETYDKIARYVKEAKVQPNLWIRIELVPNPDAGLLTIWDIAEGWIGTVEANDQIFTRQGLTKALPNNPASAGVRDAGEEDGRVVVRTGPRGGEEKVLRTASADAVDPKVFDTEEMDLMAHIRYKQERGYHAGSHAFSVLNDLGVKRTLAVIPGFSQMVTSLRPDIRNAGERGVIGTGEKRAWEERVFRVPYPIPVYAEAVKKAFTDMTVSGNTAFGSRVDFAHELRAYHYLLRKEGRLPIRHAYSYEMHRNELASASMVESVYPFMGAHWANNNSTNRWLWNHGISSEGAWDTPEIACLGPDLPGLPAVADEAKARERCGFLEEGMRTPEIKGMQNALKEGWRIVGLHGVGSHGLRLFIQFVEEAIKQGIVSEEEVRQMRLALAHGTMVGTVPDVIAGLKKYNIMVPIQITRALRDEPAVIDFYYGPEGYEFLAPVNSLLEAGVKVVGETHNAGGRPDLVFNPHLDSYVNRELHLHGEAFTPDEAVDRVVALKLMTIRAAEYMHAETFIGSLEVGKMADFVVIEKNYLEGPNEEIGKNQVLRTVVGGRVMYENPIWKWEVKP
jgi:imidazolonepropionase-like amidohydrolase